MPKLVVRAMTRCALGIKRFELVHPEGAALPAFTAGAHVDVTTPIGLVRPFSLCNDPAERHRYVLAVLRESQGRGGSKAMHDKIAPGHTLSVSEPKNDFPLEEEGEHWTLVAGGIGATPLVAMAYRLHALRRCFDFHYCARSREHLPFRAELEALVAPDRLHIHANERAPLARLLAKPSKNAFVYCCGPPSLMGAVRSATADWSADRVRFEAFKVDVPEDATAFEVELARSGQIVPVRETESILVALWRAGITRPLSCEVGICGTCRTPYLEGEPEHKDTLLTPEERQRELLVCISRCRGRKLVLDI
ncbi:PDR/VanB family oxidoreductase [Pendulispora rubella]|uniref:PDR/VanB family oxidoreductase n=1 Tax=Pendulispora rubella TaxID=2741070 RepID=A0ABZ2LKN8_9BACT